MKFIFRNAIIFALLTGAVMLRPLAAETNQPPTVRIVYPETGGFTFSSLWMRIKAEAFDADGSIAEVRFYANDKLVGIATNAPYNILKLVNREDTRWVAIARDNLGAEAESPLVILHVSEAPVGGVAVIEPEHGTIVAAGTDLEIKADITAIASQVWTNFVRFYLDGHFMGERKTGPITPTNAPATLIFTNVAEGVHEISVEVINVGCACPTHTIRAVNLAIRDPVLTADHQLDFEVITAFPGKPTVIEYSTDFDNWLQLQTITPETNYSRFTVPIEPGTSHRWYRVSLVVENP